MLTLDFMAKRYGKLPSEIVESGSSIDVQVANLGIRYENYLQKRENEKAGGKINQDLSEDEMLQMLNTVRK